jgi:F-type H+-transporting ATPase subunit b
VLIDWFTVGAQIVNFLVLVALLKYFLYGRIIRAMREREEKIAARLTEAQEREEEAKQELRSYQHKNEELGRQRDQMLARAREDADLERKRLLQEAREEVERTKIRWYEALAREKEVFLADLRQRVGRHIYDIARQALADLADAELEERLVAAFCERLERLDQDQRRALEDFSLADQEVVITSAFVLPEGAKSKIAGILQRYRGDVVKLEFRTSPEVISGIELKFYGHKIAWSLDNYLDELEEDLQGALEEEV